DIVDSIYEICKLVQKKGCLKSKKLCLYHQIDKCLGPCELPISKQRYQEEIDKAIELVQNKKLLLEKLKERMFFYSDELRFEEAKELRDRCERIEKSEIKSEIDFASNESYDIFVVKDSTKRAVVVRLFMRNGKIISSNHDFINLNDGYSEDELYKRVLLDFYSKEKPPIVAPILVGAKFDEIDEIQEHLSGVFGKKASIINPQRGKKKDLIELALLNADELLKKEKKDDKSKILEELKELLKLKRLPNRAEIFDNSHMAGRATVGAMVVYDNGEFDKKSYRVYHLEVKDEYAQMRETLTRRVNSFSKNSPPDIWIIDGGTTLLKLAYEILESCGVYIDVIAISKEKIDAKSHRAKGKANDIIHTIDESFKLQNSDKRLQWVQNLRDEAHRSAITFHKKTKLKEDQESQLLTLKGISQAKIKKLLNHFGTFEMLRKVTEDEIASILNTKDAKVIKNIYT
ncbi:MAG: excinuclease ABC subunit C, partial [Campylobacterales bacterium]|nr:excinuclease ABC subunit C [Campylobacterales bacterium]